MAKNASILGIGIPIQLQEGDDKKPRAPKEIQLLKTGRFNHPFFGPFNLTPQTFKQFKEHFDKGVKGVDPAIDFRHDVLGEAAAWLTDVILKQNGTQLWAGVEWTDVGRTAVENKRFRYISADFSDSFKEQETGKVFGNVLNGGTLTNRPFLKNMKPTTELVQLTEIQEGDEMKTTEELQTELDAEKAKTKALETEKETLTTSNTQLTEENTKLKEDPEKKKEEPPTEAEKKLSDENTELKDEIEKTKKKEEFNKMLAGGTVVEAQREHYLKGDMAQFASTFVNTQQTAGGTAGSPKGTEIGNAKTKTPIQDNVLKLAAAKRKEDESLGFNESVSIVLSEDTELETKYDDEVESQAG